MRGGGGGAGVVEGLGETESPNRGRLGTLDVSTVSMEHFAGGCGFGGVAGAAGATAGAAGAVAAAGWAARSSSVAAAAGQRTPESAEAPLGERRRTPVARDAVECSAAAP